MAFVPLRQAWALFDDAAQIADPGLGWVVGGLFGDGKLSRGMLGKLEHALTLYQGIYRLVRFISAEASRLQQKLYDVAWSDNRQMDEYGKLPPVGNTVDVSTATYTNSIGDTQFSATWTDPDFGPTQHAVYYVRAIEILTPRWSTYDAVALGIDPHPDAPTWVQERAWTSPIWYMPAPELVEKTDFYPGLLEKLRPSNFDESKLDDY